MSIHYASARGFLFDLDGVWFVGDEPIAGAAETLQRLRHKNLPFRIVTNTTTRTSRDLASKLAHMGLGVMESEIIGAPRATALLLERIGCSSCHLLIDDRVRCEFAAFTTSPRPDAVVVGDIGNRWDYDMLNEAFRMLIGGSRLVAMHRGRYWEVGDGLALDIGAFVAGLEYAAGATAIVVGKPSSSMFEVALADMGVAPGHAVMIGDDIHADIGGAMAAGIRAAIVRTGKYRQDLVASAGVVPDDTLDSIADLARLL